MSTFSKWMRSGGGGGGGGGSMRVPASRSNGSNAPSGATTPKVCAGLGVGGCFTFESGPCLPALDLHEGQKVYRQVRGARGYAGGVQVSARPLSVPNILLSAQVLCGWGVGRAIGH